MGIKSFPVELIACICDFVPDKDLFHLRQSCSRLEETSRDVFIRRHVESLVVPVEKLDVLGFPSQNDTWRHKVRSLNLVVATVKDTDLLPAADLQRTLTQTISRLPKLTSLGLQPRKSYVRSFRGGLDGAYILNALMLAAAASGNSIQQLNTCAGPYQACISESLEIETPDPSQLQHILRDLQSLHVCSGFSAIWHDNSREPHDMLERLILATASGVRSLSFDLNQAFDAIQASYAFERLAQKVHFQRLTNLEMTSIRVSDVSLQRFLASSKSTLRSLKLSHTQMQKTRSAIDSCISWRKFFNFLREGYELTYVELSCLGHAGVYWTLIDGTEASKPLPVKEYRNSVSWSSDSEKISFKDWISQIYFSVHAGDTYSTSTNMATHRFGNDSDLDHWLQKCGLGPLS